MRRPEQRTFRAEFPMFQRLTILLPLLFVGCTYGVVRTVTGSGVRTTSTRTVAPFTDVVAFGAFELHLIAGASATEVVVEGDDNLVPRFVTEVSGDQLSLHLESGSYNPKTPLVVRISMPRLKRLHASGAIRVDATGISGAQFGADLSGASDLRLAGTVDRAVLTSSGACKVHAFDLGASRVDLDLSGASKAEVSASQLLDVQASGASKVRYRGKPEVKTSTSGASSVAPE